LNLQRKRRAFMQKTNVSHGSTKMDKMVRRRGLHCVRRWGPLYKGRVIRGTVLMSMKIKKVMKKQRRGNKKIGGKKWYFVAKSGVWI
jgi:hypothetical protein